MVFSPYYILLLLNLATKIGKYCVRTKKITLFFLICEHIHIHIPFHGLNLPFHTERERTFGQ